MKDETHSNIVPHLVLAEARAASLVPGPLQPGMPARAPSLMPQRPRRWGGPAAGPAAQRLVVQTRVLAVAGALAMLAGLVWLMVWALGPMLAERPVLAGTILFLFSVNTLWISWAAAIATLGLRGAGRPALRLRPATDPGAGRVAILITLCGEDVAPVATAVAELRRDLVRTGFALRCDIFLLSDTAGPAAIALEAEAIASLAGLPGVHYRRRAERVGRKPGNLADWVRGWGGDYAYMAVLDADSRMTAERLGALVAQMDGDASLGMVQGGMRLLPATSRFGSLQRLSTRLSGPVFISGLTDWAGREGNFWGHNAVLRVAAFAGAAGLPRLPGQAPFGGDILSHDFIEAAWLRRAGWGVAIAPETRGSFEDGPQTLGAFHRRDRRWCQGNLQHLMLVFGARMHWVSRLHLISGIHSYLAAPIWLSLVVLMAVAQPSAATFLPLVAVLALLLVPKLAGALHWLGKGRALRRRPGVLVRALGAELVLSTLLAPLVLVRQTAAVVAVFAGRDCGWTPAAAQPRLGTALRHLPSGVPEAAAGAALVGLALALGAGAMQIAWLAPLLLPLLAAPVLVAWLDAPRRPAPKARLVPVGLLGIGRARPARRAA